MISKLQITVSDPWEFCEDNGGSSIFIAKLIDCKDDGILFYSDNPIILRSKTEKKEWHNFWGTQVRRRQLEQQQYQLTPNRQIFQAR